MIRVRSTLVVLLLFGAALILTSACGGAGKVGSGSTSAVASGGIDWSEIEKELAEGKYSDALTKLDEGRVGPLEVHRKHFYRGQALEGLRKPAEAERAYRDAIASKDDFAEGHNNLGNLLREYGKLDLAQKSFARAAQLAPKSPEPQANLGLTKIDLGRFSEGMKELRKASKLAPDAIWVRVYIVDALRQSGDNNEALKEAKAAAAKVETDWESALQLSMFLRSHKEFVLASSMLSRVTAKKANAILWTEFALVELGAGKIEDAAKYAAVARGEMPNDGFVHYVSAVIERKRGNLERAREFASIAVARGPQDLRNQARRLLASLKE